MSGQRPQPPAKKQPVFRKSDFVIRNKQADTFSQIDSFKVTAKKQAGESYYNNLPSSRVSAENS